MTELVPAHCNFCQTLANQPLNLSAVVVDLLHALVFVYLEGRTEAVRQKASLVCEGPSVSSPRPKLPSEIEYFRYRLRQI